MARTNATRRKLGMDLAWNRLTLAHRLMSQSSASVDSMYADSREQYEVLVS
jgi:hypothetical protein